MTKLLLPLPLLIAGCKTRVNTLVCCTDEADCTAHDLPVGTTCDDGLLCRGNQCIAEACASAADCEQSAPYCVLDDNSCEEMCTADGQCPGFGQDSSQRFCVGGDCVQCRDGMNDCPANAPVCENSACRGCVAHSECASGVCGTDGTCVDEGQVDYVDPSGSPSSECSKLSPCTLSHALALSPPKVYVVLAPGTYSNAGTLVLTDQHRWFIGSGGPRPILRNSSTGSVVKIAPAGDITLEHLEISGAVAGSVDEGNGVQCGEPGDGGTRVVHLIDNVLAQNAACGFRAVNCSISVERTMLTNNNFGMCTTDSSGTIDRTTANGNVGRGIDLDGGTYSVTNSFIFRNGGGLALSDMVGTGNQIEFNTIVDNNGTAGGMQCGISTGPQTSFPNNIIARNSQNNISPLCLFPSSIITNDVLNLHFKSPDVAPFDYHIGAGSIAIDAATVSSVDHDFDGDPRPLGGGRDIGADEAQ